MKIHDIVTKEHFESNCECGNMPETDEAISCMFCEHNKTLRVTNYGMPLEYRRCCIKHKFELCSTTSSYHRCDDFNRKS